MRQSPFGRHSKPQKADAERVGNLLDLRQMRLQFQSRLVQRLDRRARQLELSARLQRNRAAASNVIKADNYLRLCVPLIQETEATAVGLLRTYSP